MKKYNKIFAGVMALSIAFVGGAIVGQGYNTSPALMTANAEEKYGDLTYVVNEDNTITITDCNTDVTEVDIPSKINGIPVTIIGEKAFGQCKNLTSITIPNSVVSFDEFAFNSSGLTSIKIPDSVTSIGCSAFGGCSNLVSITIPDNVTNIDVGVFFGCTNLNEIIILNPECEIYDNGTTISNIVNSPLDCYFYGTIYGYNNSTAQKYAEKYNYEFKIIDSENITTTSSTISTTQTTTTTTTTISGVTTTEKYGDLTYVVNDDNTITITDCNTTETEIDIPDNINSIPVTSIGKEAFAYCQSLEFVTIPDSITSIGQSAFESCKSLTSVNIPDSVTSIDAYTFAYCDSLESMIIPDSVTSIGINAFWSCKSLVSVTLSKSLTKIGSDVFAYCSALTSVTIPNSVTSIGVDAFRGCSALISVTISDNLTKIGSTTFAYCSSLESVTIPNSVTSIGSEAFSLCTNLSEITILNPNCTILDNTDTIYRKATIFGYDNSTAYEYAQKYNRTFSSLGETPPAITATTTTTSDNTTTTTTTISGNTTADKKGDINSDGLIDAVDASLILSYYAYLSTTQDNPVMSISEFQSAQQ